MNPMPFKCSRCGIERETLETPCLVCGFKPDHQPTALQVQTSGSKRPIAHVVWFTLVIVTLALAVFQCLGDLVRAFFDANREFTNRPLIVGLYALAASICAFVGYKLLPGKGHLTLLRAVLWRIYSGILLNVVHWITFATVVQGWYVVDWANSVTTAVIFYASLGLLALCIWGAQKIRGRNLARVGIPEAQSGNSTIGNVKGWIASNRTPCSMAVAVIVVASVVFAFKPSDRFYLVTNADGYTYRIDKTTGKTWHIYGSRMVEVKQVEKPKVKAPAALTENKVKNNRSKLKDSLLNKIGYVKNRTKDDKPDAEGLTLDDYRNFVTSSDFNTLDPERVDLLAQAIDEKFSKAVYKVAGYYP